MGATARPIGERAHAAVRLVAFLTTSLSLAFAAGYTAYDSDAALGHLRGLEFASSEGLATSELDVGAPLPLWQWAALGLCALAAVVVLIECCRAALRRLA